MSGTTALCTQVSTFDADLDGSVRQNAATNSPVASLGKYFCFCASFPAIRIPCLTKMIQQLMSSEKKRDIKHKSYYTIE